MRIVLIASTLFYCTALTVEARAQEISLELAVGLTDCTDEYCEDGTIVFDETSPGLGVLGAAWVRVHPLLQLGLSGHVSYVATDEPRGVDTTLRYASLDGGVRVQPPLELPVNLFGGLTFGWSFFDTFFESDLDDGSGSLSGPNVALHLGGDWPLGSSFALGALFKYAFPFWSDYCYESDALGDDCMDPEDAFDDEDLPNVWFLGLLARWTPGA